MAARSELERLCRSLEDQRLSASPRRFLAAAAIIDDIAAYTRTLTTPPELALSASILLGSEQGLLSFLRQLGLELYEECKVKALDFLATFIQRLPGDRLQPYAIKIKDTCLTCFRDKKAKVKSLSFRPLIALFSHDDLFTDENRAQLLRDLKADALLKKYLDPFHSSASKLTATVKRDMMHAIGLIVSVSPGLASSPLSTSVLNVYLSELRKQMTGSKAPELPTVEGCFRGLTAFLRTSPVTCDAETRHATPGVQIYNYVKMAIGPDVTAKMTRFQVPRTALDLFATHADLFRGMIARDFELLLQHLSAACEHHNKDIKAAAFRALEAFLLQISVHMSKAGRSKDTMHMFGTLFKRFKAAMQEEAGQRATAIAIRGYGYLAAPCKQLCGMDDLRLMSDDLARRCQQLYFNPANDEQEEDAIHLSSFIDAIARLIQQLEESGDVFLPILERLIVLMLEAYPNMYHTQRNGVHLSMIRCFVSLYHKGSTLQSFFAKVANHIFLRACSQSILDTEDLAEGAVDKSYLDLLRGVLKGRGLAKVSEEDISHEDRNALMRTLYDETLKAFLHLVNKLDLSTHTPGDEDDESVQAVAAAAAGGDASKVKKEAVVGEEPPHTKMEDASDPTTFIVAARPKDIQVLIHLAAFGQDLFSTTRTDLFPRWLHIFYSDVVTRSTKYPLVSSLYKLLELANTIASEQRYFDAGDGHGERAKHAGSMGSTLEAEACRQLMSKFGREVMIRSKQYKDELLSACLTFVLSLPLPVVKEDFGVFFPAIETALSLGLGYYPLADAGLTALEAWLPPALKAGRPMGQLLPLLDKYLSAAVAASDVDVEEEMKALSRSISRKKEQAAVVAMDTDNPFAALRMRILRLLGAMGGRYNHVLASLAAQGPASAAAADASARRTDTTAQQAGAGGGDDDADTPPWVAWDMKEHLRFAVPFQEMKPEVQLDPMLPRIVELALSSGDRQTRTAACELLHAIMLYMLGLGGGADARAGADNDLGPLYKHVLPALLRLACDVDLVPKQLFAPLVMQIIHWFSSSRSARDEVALLLDAILDGLTDSKNSALRDFCATCVTEFFVWAHKHSSDRMLASGGLVKVVLKRIISMALHPNTFQRMGAALAMNNIYTRLRESPVLVDVYVLELTDAFMRSLQLSKRDDPAMGTAEHTGRVLSHLRRIVLRKIEVFRKPSQHRRVPPGWEDGTVHTLTRWALTRSRDLHAGVRHQAMEFFLHLAPLDTDPKTNKPYATARAWLTAFGADNLVKLVERDESSDESGSGSGGGGGQEASKSLLEVQVKPKSHSRASIHEWLERLQATLEAYKLVLGHRILSPADVFVACKQEVHVWAALAHFLSVFPHLPELHRADTPAERASYRYLKCTVMVRVLDFLRTVLRLDASALPGDMWTKALVGFICKAVLTPIMLDFDPSDPEIEEKLPKKTGALLTELAQQLDGEPRQRLLSGLQETLQSEECDLLQMVRDVLPGREVPVPLIKNVVAGVQQLLAAGLLQECMDDAEAYGRQLLATLFEFSHTATPEPTSLSMAVLLADLAFCLSVPRTQLLSMLRDNTPTPQAGRTLSTLLASETDTATQTTRGALFYDTYHEVLAPYVARHFAMFAQQLLPHIGDARVLRLVRGAAHALAAGGADMRRYADDFTAAFLDGMAHVQAWINSGAAGSEVRVQGMRLLSAVLRCGVRAEVAQAHANFPRVMEVFTQFLEDRAVDMTSKRVALQLLGTLCQGTQAVRTQCATSLNAFTQASFPLRSREYGVDTAKYKEFIAALDDILDALVNSGSLELLEVVVTVHQREDRDHVHEAHIQRKLREFIVAERTDTEQALELMFQIFLADSNPLFVRRGVAQRVLATFLAACRVYLCRAFYTKRLPAIMSLMSQDTPLATTHTIVIKMCTFTLVDILFQRLSTADLYGQAAIINKTYCEAVGEAVNDKGSNLTTNTCRALRDVIFSTKTLTGEESLVELRRQASCAAYNALTTVICKTQSQEKFYAAFCFKEGPGKMIWSNLIDESKTYLFSTELSAAMGIRSKRVLALRNRQATSSHSDDATPPAAGRRYLPSHILADSSLSQDAMQLEALRDGADAAAQQQQQQQQQQQEQQQQDEEGGSASSAASSSVPNVGAEMDMGEDGSGASPVYVLEEGQLEMDELNSHECMVSLMALIERIQSVHPESRPQRNDDGLILPSTTMPSWMSHLLKSFENTTTSHNVRLFIAKLITNMPDAFQPWASRWLRPIMLLILKFQDDRTSQGFNYFVTDLCLLLLTWADTAVPQDESEKRLARQLVQFLMENARHETTAIFKNNVNIIRLLLERWTDAIQDKVPFHVIVDNMSSRQTASKDNLSGLHLLSLVLANEMLPSESALEDLGLSMRAFFQTLAVNLTFKSRSVYRTAAFVIGMLLNHFKSKNMPTLLEELTKEVLARLDRFRKEDDTTSKERLVTCLHQLCNVNTGHPPIVDHFVQRLLFLAPSLPGQFKTMALETLLWRAEDIVHLFKELQGKGLVSLIKHHHTETQAVVLSILKVLLHRLKPADIKHFLPTMTASCCNHDDYTVRAISYDILMAVYDMKLRHEDEGDLHLSEAGEEDLKAMTHLARTHLLLGLQDSSPKLRQAIVAYWDQEKRLARNPVQRLYAGLTSLYVPEAEEAYLQFVTNIMLQLTKHSPDFDRELFTHPLSSSTWRDYRVDASWRQRNLHMTPLFAATQQSQSQSQLGAGLDTFDEEEFGVRATQSSLAFTPTMGSLATTAATFEPGGISGQTLTHTQYTSSQQVLLFERRRRRGQANVSVDPSLATPQRAAERQARGAREIARLRRRFIKSKDKNARQAIFHAKRTAARKREARRLIDLRRKARSAQVTLFRSYRTGELPDIQIKQRELLQPLQGLAQRDSQLARMVFEALFYGILHDLTDILSERDAGNMKVEYSKAINTLLQATRKGYTPFIATLHNLMRASDPASVTPMTVSLTSAAGRCFHTGALLLEAALGAAGEEAATQPPAAKRSRMRTAKNGLTDDEIERWVYLGRLFKELGDYDTLHGIFANQTSSKATQRAARLEAAGRFDEAAMVYKECMFKDEGEDDEDIPVCEVDLWEETLAECSLRLCDWKDLENVTLTCVDTEAEYDEAADMAQTVNANDIWTQPRLLQRHLPHLITARLRTACEQLVSITVRGEAEGGGADAPKMRQLHAFVEDARPHTDRWSHMQYHFALELAVLSVLRDEYDLARYHLSQALERFLGDWATLSPLMIETRRSALQRLQSMVELQEFLDFIGQETNLASETSVKTLLSSWAQRTPTPYKDPIHVWDEVTAFRRVFFNKVILGAYRPHFGAATAEELANVDLTQHDTSIPARIRRMLVVEEANQCLRMAHQSSVQGPLQVAEKYHKTVHHLLNTYTFDDDTSADLSLRQAHGLVEYHLHEFRLGVRQNDHYFRAFSRDLQRLRTCGPTRSGSHAKYRAEVLLSLGEILPQCPATDDNKELWTHVGKEVDVSDQTRAGERCVARAFDVLLEMAQAADPHKAALPVGWRQVPSRRRAGQFAYVSPFGDRIGKRPMEPPNFNKKPLGIMFQSATAFDGETLGGFVRLAEFCADVLQHRIGMPQEDHGRVKQVFVESALTAMRSGNVLMRQYFPQLLNLAMDDQHINRVLAAGTISVPCWMLLQWIPQMLAVLDTPESSVVQQVLDTIANTYPQALCFPVMLSAEKLNFERGGASPARSFFQKLKEKVTTPHLERFVEELKCLTNPFMAYADWLEAQEDVVQRRDKDALHAAFKHLKAELLVTSPKTSNGRQVGVTWQRAAKTAVSYFMTYFGSDGSKLLRMDVKAYQKAKRALKMKLRELDGKGDSKSQSKPANTLKAYSPWLSTYRSPGTAFDIEIPGQYGGAEKPVPEEHAVVEGFDEKLLIMASMRRPMRLTFRGSDEREHRFLVKAGEDLRTDARMEQLFVVMNQALASDPACSERGLSLRTYNVIPMTTRIGMLEWVPNATVFKEMISLGMTDAEREELKKNKRAANAARNHFSQFAGKYTRDSSALKVYSTVMAKAKRSDIVRSFRERQGLARSTLMRDALLHLSTTPEAYLTTRQLFGRTLATMNVCQYILGIGDRHLSNSMVDLRTGGVVGIDFGHNFGSATQELPIPELMPFRFTKQLEAVFLPHKKEGLVQEVMVHVLRALKTNQRLLLSTMDVFIKEPSLDWQQQARGNVAAFAQKKIDVAKRKLSGDNPAHVLRAELKENRHVTANRSWLRAAEAIIVGDPKSNIRATMPEHGLSVEDQVRCLLDQATDPCILGVTWAGWEPWQ